MHICMGVCVCVGGRAHQITAPLIPKVKGAGDTRHFPEYEENKNLFKIGRDIVHAKEFEDF